MILLPGLLAFSVFVLGPAARQAEVPPKQPYRWKSVQMVGGGFVDGIVFHPTAKGVRYARTDIGGAYRWEPRIKSWVPILDWLSYEDTNLMGVESIALDPHDSQRVYLACGMYSNSGSPNAAILRSRDRGRTFERSNLPFKMGGNENGRGNGERLAVDPNSGSILFFGSRRAGLWRSADYGATWSEVASFPFAPGSAALAALPGGVGINVVQFDPASGRRGSPSSVIYAAISASDQPNLLRSRDGGETWQPIAGEPTTLRPTRMVLASNGALYITYGSSAGPSAMRDGAVWRLDTHANVWTDITPERPDPNSKRFGYAAVSVQSGNPDCLIVSTFYRPGGEEIYRSLDGGKHWRPVIHSNGTYDFSLAPYVSKTPIHWLFDVEIDPANLNHAMFTTGYGGYETFNLTDADRDLPVHWQVMSKGIEETVALELVSPAQGAHLFSAIGDYGGFVHWNLDRPSPEGNYGNPTFGNTTGVACASAAPNVIVRVGTAAGNHPGANIGYSLDGGKTWQPPASAPTPTSRSGSVAISADGASWIWSAEGSLPSVTHDRGATWSPVTGLPRNTRIVPDPVASTTFYAIDMFDGKFFASRDNGSTFASQPLILQGGLPDRGGNRGDGRGGQDRLYAAPGQRGDLWVAAYGALYHCSNSNALPFLKLPLVEQIHAFGFGKAPPGKNDPALFLVGIVQGRRGVFRSDDFGASWIRINDDAHQWGLILQVAGDPRIFGRVYVGTHGRGVLYGDPQS